MKSVVVIGSGNLAEALAWAVSRTKELELRQIFARNRERAREIAAISGTTSGFETEGLVTADIYLLAVSDTAIASLAAHLPIPATAALIHTAGGIGINILPDHISRRGVLYPLQTFTRGRRVDFSEIPIFVEGNSESFTQELEAFAHQLSRTVRRADSAQRLRLHLAAVFACNFVNHLYALGEEVLQQADLPFELLKPLIAETAAKALDSGNPIRMQTGPAVRGDRTTQQRHEALLQNNAHLHIIYEILSQNIWETSKKTL